MRLKVDPSIWILTILGARESEVRTIGVVGTHIDDFLRVGNENNSRWDQFLEDFRNPFGSRAISVQGVSNCLTSGILLRGGGCLFDVLELVTEIGRQISQLWICR